jgi:hypothetical protein
VLDPREYAQWNCDGERGERAGRAEEADVHQ